MSILVKKYRSMTGAKIKRNFFFYAKRYQFSDEEKVFLKKYPSLKPVLKRVKHNEFVLERKKLVSIDAMDDLFRRMYYVSYADDLL